ncbi:MAG: DUF309 domain-containing protein [Verrucomicrobiota bacterium]
MSKKSSAIAALIEGCRGQDLDAHYLGYFECFNRQLFFEAHDVLEELWLTDRTGPNYAFYKGLIQLAGAFVHLQKNRMRPSAALFKLAEANLLKYPVLHDELDLAEVLKMIRSWSQKLEAGLFEINPLAAGAFPRLNLIGSASREIPIPENET